MNMSNQQTTGNLQSGNISYAASLSKSKQRSAPRRTSSGILKKAIHGNNGYEGAAAALPVKRRGSYQHLKRSVASTADGGDGCEGGEDVSEVGSVTSAEEVRSLSSPEYKQTHWEQFGTAQVLLLSVGVDEELMSFYDQALSAEGYDVLCVEDVIEVGDVLKQQKVEPDLALLLCEAFQSEEAEVLAALREVDGLMPVFILSKSDGDKASAMKQAQGYMQQSEDVDDLVTNLNVLLKRRHEAKLNVENMIEHAQKLLTQASFKRTILFTLAEEEVDEEPESLLESTLLAQRQQVQQVLDHNPKLRNQAVSLLALLDKDVWAHNALQQDNMLQRDLLALKQLL
eukprot:TRINITY_DN6897_c0_g1_i12.p2 TRINITY_DN6897_c0_g1~~TRINITY_DN6897_c0_g1_i12.p2  ORF type:complete len:342 (+),score=61.11 TRINITY_DN6897_c0_g1_i12:251-1276(+)